MGQTWLGLQVLKQSMCCTWCEDKELPLDCAGAVTSGELDLQ